MIKLTDSSYPFEFIGISKTVVDKYLIGAADERDAPDGVRTRRYRVYKTYIKCLSLEEQFESAFYDLYSLGVLINRKSVTDINAYMQQILDFVTV